MVGIREETDGCRIMHGRNGREYRPPDTSLVCGWIVRKPGRFTNFACVTGMDIPFHRSVASVH